MQYRSIADLNRDVVEWSDRLPGDLDLVVGIPRSGLLAATMLALHRHLPLTDVTGLLEGRLLGGGRRMAGLEDRDVVAEARHVLVVDDSVHSGRSLAKERERLEGHPLSSRVSWGAVYVARRRPPDGLDFWHSVVPMPRAFEWNVLHHKRLPDACMDIDGVLCRDPDDRENDDGEGYQRFLADVPARLVPAGEVGWLVTNRLERYRPETEAWLHEQGIRFRNLLMHPADTAEERRAAADHAEHKARVYRETGAWLFIESDLRQAHRIADLSRKAVFCTDVREMVFPGVPTGSSPRAHHRVLWQVPTELGRLRRRSRRVGRRIARRLGGS